MLFAQTKAIIINMNAYDKVRCTRTADRPMASDFIGKVFEDFTELHGDRRFHDDRAVIAGIARLDGRPVTVIGIEKGRTLEERMTHNFGCAHPEGYRKALRLMKQAEKFHRPVICFVDTSGAYCGVGAEERGQGLAIAENLFELMTLATPVISVVIGEGGSGGALALAVADNVWMLENAYYSVISPEGCASIIYKDATKAPQVADALGLTAQSLLKLGIIERIIDEPKSFRDTEESDAFYASFKKDLSSAIGRAAAKPMDALLAARYEKYRRIGRA